VARAEDGTSGSTTVPAIPIRTALVQRQDMPMFSSLSIAKRLMSSRVTTFFRAFEAHAQSKIVKPLDHPLRRYLL